MKKAALYLAFCLSAICAFGQSGSTTITANHIAYFGGTTITGNFCVTPTDQTGAPINITTNLGQQVSPQTPLCFPILAGVLSASAIVPDTSMVQPVNACYSLVISDFYGKQVGVFNCIQPTTNSWSFDSYVPTSLPNIPALTMPQFQLNGVALGVQTIFNVVCSGCSKSGGSVTFPTSGAPSVVTNSILGNNSGSTAAAFALTPTQVSTMLGLGTASSQSSSAFDAAGAASTAQGLSLQKASNLSDLGNASAARTSLGLGAAAQQALSVFAQTSNNLSDLQNEATARTNLGLAAMATASGPNFPTNAQTAAYQVLAADFAACKTITVASGTFTITLVASGSQPTTGQCVHVINYGTGVVTIARSGQNLNGGTSSLTLPAGSATAPTGAAIVSDGTNYEAALWGVAASTALAASATNLAGTSVDSAPYQSASATTSYIASPTISGHTFVYAWQPSGSAVAPGALDFTTYLASPPCIGCTTPAAGNFTSLSSSPPTGDAGMTSWPGNTVEQTIPAHNFAWGGFLSASATAYGYQPSATAPTAGQLDELGAPDGSGWSAITHVNPTGLTTAAQCLAAAVPITTPCIAGSGTASALNGTGTTGTITFYTSSAPSAALFNLCVFVAVDTAGTAGTITPTFAWTTPGGLSESGAFLGTVSMTTAFNQIGSCAVIQTKVSTSFTMSIAAGSATGSPLWEYGYTLTRLH